MKKYIKKLYNNFINRLLCDHYWEEYYDGKVYVCHKCGKFKDTSSYKIYTTEAKITRDNYISKKEK